MDNDLPPASSVPVPSTQPASDRLEPSSQPPFGGWGVDAGRGWHWWTEGWRLFIAAPIIWILIGIIFFAIMIGLAWIPFIGQIASTLIYPILGAGVLIGTRELDRGGQLKVGHLFSCFNDKAVPLVIVALLYFGGWFVIWILSAGLLVAIAGVDTLKSMMSGDPMEASMAMLSGAGIAAVIVFLFMLLIGTPLIMAYWYAPALVVFRGDQPIAAMKESFIACWRNIPPFCIYTLIGIVLAIVATIPFGLGWFVLAPVYVASLYPSYKDIFGEG